MSRFEEYITDMEPWRPKTCRYSYQSSFKWRVQNQF